MTCSRCGLTGKVDTFGVCDDCRKKASIESWKLATPGSPEAVKLGCMRASISNNRWIEIRHAGIYSRMNNEPFVLNKDCPIHTGEL